MDLLDNNELLLRTLARFFGVSNIQGTTDTPAAQIKLSYMRRGVEHKSSFTVQEVLDAITEHTVDAHTEAPAGYTDIADIP